MSVAVGQTPETRNVRGVALYMALVARFPLRPLRSERESTAPPEIANELAVRGNLSRWEHDYLDVLSDLIEAYEAAHHPIPDLSGPEMLRHLLTERGISQASAAREMGMAPSTVSDILRGKRYRTQAHQGVCHLLPRVPRGLLTRARDATAVHHHARLKVAS